MAFKETSSPVPAIRPEELPNNLSNHLWRNFVADLAPRPTTPGMDLWTELRYMATGERNYPRWSKTLAVNGARHTVALFGVSGERPNGEAYFHSALRCSCCLPDHKSFKDLDDEYQSCAAKDQVISDRVRYYREYIGSEELGRINKNTLIKAAVFLLDVIKKDSLAWPPSHRSDQLLVDPMADIYDVPRRTVRDGIQELAADEVVIIHGETNPSISLAA